MVSPQDRRTPHTIGWSVAAAVTVTSVFVLSNAPTPLYVAWQREWGFSSGMLTVIFACYMAGLVGTLIVAGRLADRFGRRMVLIPALLAAVLSALLFLAAQGVAWLLVARLLAGIAVGGAVTAGMAAVVDLAPASRKTLGGLLASVSMVFGAGLGPLLSGAVTEVTGTPQYWVFGIVTVLVACAVVLGLCLPLSRSDAVPAEGAPEKLLRWPRPPRGQGRELLWGAATFGPGITATSFVLSLGPSVLSELLDVSAAVVAGLVACLMFLVATGVQFLVGRLATRTHLSLSSITAVVAMLLLIGAATITPWWPVFLCSALLAGVAQGLGQLAGLTLIATRIPTERRAECNAVLNIAGYIPAGLLPVATGYFADALGLSTAVIIFAVVVGGFAAIALPVVRASFGRYGGERTEDVASAPESTLVIVAHPNLGASRVNAAWVRALQQSGATVRVLADVRGMDSFDVAAEQEALVGHDRIILQFPFRWYAAPPILSEWLDVVLQRGWAYGPGGTALVGKELGLAVSTWSRAGDYEKSGRYRRTMAELTSPFEATAARVGMDYLPGFFLHGVGDLSEEELEDAAQRCVEWATSGTAVDDRICR